MDYNYSRKMARVTSLCQTLLKPNLSITFCEDDILLFFPFFSSMEICSYSLSHVFVDDFVCELISLLHNISTGTSDIINKKHAIIVRYFVNTVYSSQSVLDRGGGF